MRAGREGFRTPPEMDSPDDLELAPLLRGGPSSPSRSELPETRCEENIGNVSGNDDALCPIENPSIDHAHTQELLWMAACVDLITNLAISAPYPFLPQLLERSGTGPYQIGCVFAAMPLGVLLVSPYVPKILWRVGASPILTRALAAEALCILAVIPFAGPYTRCDAGMYNSDAEASSSSASSSSSSLPSCDETRVLTTVAVWTVSRLLCGCASAFINTTCLVMITRLVPHENMARANGILESAIGVGYMAGPAVGGWLFRADVFSTKKSKRSTDEVRVAAALAFVALMVAALVPLASVVARRVGDVTGDFVAAEDRPAGEDDDDASPSETATNETHETNGGRDDADAARIDADADPSDGGVSSRVGRRRPIAFIELLSRPKFVAALAVLTAMSFSFGSYPSTMPPQLGTSLGVDESGIGTIYGSVAAAYAAAALAVGPLLERGGTRTVAALCALGAFACAMGHACFGPTWPVTAISEHMFGLKKSVSEKTVYTSPVQTRRGRSKWLSAACCTASARRSRSCRFCR
jgi:MFS family permease